MNKSIAILLIVTGLLFVGTVTYIAGQAAVLSHQVGIVCKEHKVLPAIVRGEIAELIANNKTITPRLRLPGISQAELVRLTQEKISRKEQNLRQLETIRKETC